MSKSFSALLAALLLAAIPAIPLRAGDHGIGRTPTAQEIAGWDIDARPDGQGLPPGKGTVAQGERIFAARCVTCHGDFGEGVGRFPPLAGGKGTLAGEDPVRTVGSFWPHAPALFDYIRRAQPFTAPQSLTVDEAYAVTGYVLHLNDLLPAEAVVDARVLTATVMPNRNGFLGRDPRPDTHNTRCMTGCKPAPVKILSEARPIGSASSPAAK